MLMSFCKQDCMVVLATYPNNPNPVESLNVKTAFDIQGTSGGRHVQTFLKVRTSLQSLRLANFLQTFFDELHTLLTLFAHFI